MGTKTKAQAYADGNYVTPPPPVNPRLWETSDWINYIDRDGGWTVEVE